MSGGPGSKREPERQPAGDGDPRCAVQQRPLLEGVELPDALTSVVRRRVAGHGLRPALHPVPRRRVQRRGRGVEIRQVDLARDIGECQNICEQHPQVVEELEALLTRYIEDGRSTAGAKQRNSGGANWEQLWWMQGS